MSLSQLRSRLILAREAEMQANESIERMSRSRDKNDMVSEEKCKNFFSFCTHFSYESLTLCFLQNMFSSTNLLLSNAFTKSFSFVISVENTDVITHILRNWTTFSILLIWKKKRQNLCENTVKFGLWNRILLFCIDSTNNILSNT